MLPSLINPVLSEALAFSVTSLPRVKASKVKAALVVLMVPLRVTVLGALATKPAL